MADDEGDEIADLEKLWKLLSDEEAEQLRRDNETRVKRARLNPGAAVAKDEIGGLALEVVAMIGVKILEGSIPIRTAGQARDVAVAFHQIARLEQGKSTSNVADMPRADREALVAELAAAASERAADRERGLRLVQDEDGKTG